MKGKSMSTKTVYETTYSLKHGFHPHAHMLFGLNQDGINKTQIHKALNCNWKNYTGANLDVTNVDQPTIYVGGKQEYPEKLESIFRQQKQEMKEHFSRSNLETMLVSYVLVSEYQNPSTSDENTTQPEPEVMGNNIKETNKDTPPTEDVSSPAFSDDDIPF